MILRLLTAPKADTNRLMKDTPANLLIGMKAI